MKFLPIFLASIAGFSTLIGLIIIYIKVKEKNINKLISILLSFSSGIILGICILDLIPVSTLSILKEGSSILKFILLFSFFLVGYFIIYIFKSFNKSPINSLYRVGIISFFIIIFHNILEGIATYSMSVYNIKLGINFTIAIIMHNIPEGILIAVPLYYSGNRNRAIQLVTLSAFAEPFGALISYIFLNNIYTNTFIAYLMILIAGLMFSLIINEILPELKEYTRYKFNNILFFIIGVVSIVINIYFLN